MDHNFMCTVSMCTDLTIPLSMTYWHPKRDLCPSACRLGKNDLQTVGILPMFRVVEICDSTAAVECWKAGMLHAPKGTRRVVQLTQLRKEISLQAGHFILKCVGGSFCTSDNSCMVHQSLGILCKLQSAHGLVGILSSFRAASLEQCAMWQFAHLVPSDRRHAPCGLCHRVS